MGREHYVGSRASDKPKVSANHYASMVESTDLCRLSKHSSIVEIRLDEQKLLQLFGDIGSDKAFMVTLAEDYRELSAGYAVAARDEKTTRESLAELTHAVMGSSFGFAPDSAVTTMLQLEDQLRMGEDPLETLGQLASVVSSLATQFQAWAAALPD